MCLNVQTAGMLPLTALLSRKLASIKSAVPSCVPMKSLIVAVELPVRQCLQSHDALGWPDADPSVMHEARC